MLRAALAVKAAEKLFNTLAPKKIAELEAKQNRTPMEDQILRDLKAVQRRDFKEVVNSPLFADALKNLKGNKHR